MGGNSKGFFAAAVGAAAAILLAEYALRSAGWLYAHWRVPGARADRGAVIILCEGDSFTFGQGAPKGESYPEQLQRLFETRFPSRVRVINRGVPGWNSSQVMARTERDVLRFRPDLVLVMAGCDDNNNFDQNHYYLFLKTWPSFWARLNSMLSHLRTYQLLRRVVVFERKKYQARLSMVAADEASQKQPPQAVAALLEAQFLRRALKPREADTVLEKALRKFPNDPDLLYWAGWLRLNRIGDSRGAASLFQRAIAQRPNDPRIAVGLFRAYQEIGDLAAAQRALVLINKILPNNPNFVIPLRYGIPRADDYGLYRHVILYDLSRLAKFCRRHGVLPVFQTYAALNWPNETIIQAARRDHAALVDNRRIFDRFKNRASFFAEDGHLNARGYGILAKNDYRALLPLVEAIRRGQRPIFSEK